MHYCAEQRHSEVNLLNKPAELFIFRVFQIDANGRRQNIWSELQAALANHTQSVSLPPHALAWIRQLLPSYRRGEQPLIQDESGPRSGRARSGSSSAVHSSPACLRSPEQRATALRPNKS